MSEHERLTAAVRQSAARMAHADGSAQYEAARKEHDAARELLDTHNAQHSDD